METFSVKYLLCSATTSDSILSRGPIIENLTTILIELTELIDWFYCWLILKFNIRGLPIIILNILVRPMFTISKDRCGGCCRVTVQGVTGSLWSVLHSCCGGGCRVAVKVVRVIFNEDLGVVYSLLNAINVNELVYQYCSTQACISQSTLTKRKTNQLKMKNAISRAAAPIAVRINFLRCLIKNHKFWAQERPMTYLAPTWSTSPILVAPPPLKNCGSLPTW